MLYNLAFYNHFSKRIGSVQILSEGHAFRDWEREHIEKLAQLLDKVLLKRAPSQVCYDPLQIYLWYISLFLDLDVLLANLILL